ncbi:hypothetical protein EUCA11A_29070 [Eubacterium callanderi]|uniref:sugar-transfer associated ATP-grasp domain-containing protein n=1 Tax=Eubacterium callanderi TaxID=53442 RepID=UPI0029FF12AF|nr:sugar-transfer associated ATP-grasp domain-containing protein [Eubacterium callanderi]WPK68733.1 hypothetical protein EUCA2A_29070 [Eubacterium callanderi]WPK73031.1 hypothetical protein EUCA11A_29070 [Eubacterium callanderi]
MKKESLKQKFKRFLNDISNNIDLNATWWKKLKIFLDFLWERYRYNTELIDYIQYRFYYKKRQEREQFITHGKLVKIIKICNDPEERNIFDQKPLFNKYFKSYLGRQWIDMSNTNKEKAKEFVFSQKNLFAKCPNGMFGKGIELIKTCEIEDYDEFYKKGLEKKLLFEEVLTQHPELAAFNNTSINSLRIVTLVCADDSVKIMAAVLRLGRKGKIADNFHHYGIAALIDIDTGIVYTVGVDREWKRYVKHPDSGKAIVGFTIPNWYEIIKVVEQAAKVVPEVRYVGWDVTIKNDGSIVLIEGNPGADPDVTQIEDQIGKWPLYEPLLKKIKELHI